MNMRVLDAVRKTPSADAVKNMYFDDIRGFVCFIPSVIVGEVMIIMYSNAISVTHRSSAVTSCEIDYETLRLHSRTADSVYKLPGSGEESKDWQKAALLPRCIWRAAFSTGLCESKPTQMDISFLTGGTEPRSTLLIFLNTLSMGICTSGMDSYQQPVSSTCSMFRTISSTIGTSMTRSTSHTTNPYVKMPAIMA